jgi:hypothetical protein
MAIKSFQKRSGFKQQNYKNKPKNGIRNIDWNRQLTGNPQSKKGGEQNRQDQSWSENGKKGSE